MRNWIRKLRRAFTPSACAGSSRGRGARNKPGRYRPDIEQLEDRRLLATLTVNPAVAGDYATIQAAVNAAAPDDTVEVAAGTYSEQVTISKDLTLIGSVGKTILMAPAVLNPDNSGRLAVLEIGPDVAVQITGLTVQGPGSEALNGPNVGIATDGAFSFNLNTCAITGIAGVGIQTEQGLVDGSDNIEDVTVSDYSKAGMMLAAQYLNVKLCTIDNTGNDGPDVGIAASATDSGNIYANNISGNTTATAPDQLFNDYLANPATTPVGVGIAAFAANGDFSVSSNQVLENDIGISGGAGAGGSLTISGNILQNFLAGAVASMGDVAITNNTAAPYESSGQVVSASEIGLAVVPQKGEGVTADIQGNQIFDNRVGIEVADPNQGDPTVDATFNTIVGNTIGVENDSGNPVVAIDNWWGSNAGPGGPGSDTIVGNVGDAPRLLLGLTGPSAVLPGASATLTVGFLRDSAGQDVSKTTSTLTVFFLEYGSTLGKVKPVLGDTYGRGVQNATFTSAVAGPAVVTATLANQTVSIPIAVGPGLSNVQVTSPINEGQDADLTGDIYNANPGDAYSLQVDWADGTPKETFTFPAGTTDFDVQHQYLDHNVPGTPYAIDWILTDDTTDEQVDSGMTFIQVNNVPPTVTILDAPATSPSGTAITLGSNVTDPSPAMTAAGFTYAWSVTKNGAPFATGTAASFTFTPDDAGSYVVTLTAADKNGRRSTPATQTIAVYDVPPTLVFLPNNGDSGVSEGFALAATDPSPVVTASGFTYTINWGDGTAQNPDVQTIPAAPGNGAGVAVAHTFPQSQTSFLVQATATDKNGGVSNVATLTVAPTVAIAYQGGPIIPQAQVETVYFGQAWGTAAQQQQVNQLDTYMSSITNSPYVDGLGEYYDTLGPGGSRRYVSRGTFLDHDIVAAGPAAGATVTEAAIQNMLAAEVNANRLKAPDGNHLYFVYLPPNVHSQVDQTNGFLGHHFSFVDAKGRTFYYAVIPNPVGNANLPGLTAFQQDTVVASHELAESLTDPSATAKGWYDPNGQEEIGDVCVGQTGTLNGYLVQKYWSVRANSGILPNPLPTSSSLGGNLQAVAWGSGSVAGSQVAFAIGPNHTVSISTQTGTGSWSAWTSLGGNVTALATGNEANGTLAVFGIGPTGAVSMTAQNGSGGWTAWKGLGGNVMALATGKLANGNLALFGINPNGAVSLTAQTAKGWTAWSSLGGNVTALAVGNEANGSLALFGMAPNGAVWTTVQTASGGWTAWGSLGGDVTALAVAKDPDGRLEVFGIGTDANIWTLTQTAVNDNFSDSLWYSLGGPVRALVMGRTSDGRLEVFGIAADYTLDVITQTAARNGNWT